MNNSLRKTLVNKNLKKVLLEIFHLIYTILVFNSKRKEVFLLTRVNTFLIIPNCIKNEQELVLFIKVMTKSTIKNMPNRYLLIAETILRKIIF